MIYHCYQELLEDIYRHGKEIGPRGLKTKELRRVQLHIFGYNAIHTKEARPWKDIRAYLFAEMAWYMCGDRYVETILPHSKFWDKIKNADGTANSNYGDLVFYRQNKFGMTSFNWAFKELCKDKDTRKAICLYNDREFFFSENKDLICNQYQHFFIRDNLLECDVALRSSDAIFGLTFNIPWWSLVHQQLFLHLKPIYPELKLGNIVANISSAHIYENKFELVEKMLAEGIQDRFLELKKVIPLNYNFKFYNEYVFPENKDVYLTNTQ